jgi:APA family basic amino acid/polyamine antiporter
MIFIFSLIHYFGLVMGSRVQNGLTLFKVVLIVIFIVAGLCSGNGSSANFGGGLDLKTVFQGKFAVSLIFISFAYSGWNAAAYLGSEIRKARRNIPLALITGTCIVTFIYLLLNVVYIYALSPDKMAGVLEVGARSAVHLFGESTSRYFSGAIALCLLSVLSAMIMAGPRVYYAMARDGIFFGIFGQVSKVHRTPSYSVFLQSGIAIVMVITASFEKLLLYIGFTLSLFASLAVVGMMMLRIKKPDLDREYRAFGYPITPLLFILGNAWIVYFTVKSRPVTALFGSATIALGILAYLYFRNRRKEGRPYETPIAPG